MSTKPATSIPPLRRWLSSSGDATQVAELLDSHADVERLAAAIASVAPDLGDCAMLIVRLDRASNDGILAACIAVQKARLPVRVCLAIGKSELRFVDQGIAIDDAMGLMLDNVDAQTPLGDLVHESIDAIRFDATFAIRASNHLRSEYVLDSMLGLARNIGLATMGPSIRTSDGSCLAPPIEFDYVPEVAESRPVGRGRTRRGVESGAIVGR